MFIKMYITLLWLVQKSILIKKRLPHTSPFLTAVLQEQIYWVWNYCPKNNLNVIKYTLVCLSLKIFATLCVNTI